jgi:uncharacterized protein YfkK (UPF0435 family)
MVKVEPFIYQKMTAFRERIQMVDKINEMIDVLNDGIDPEEVKAIITEELGNYYDKAEIDEMFSTIDFSPYYTKTEVDTIVSRIDGDVDEVEGKVNTAESDINALKGRMGTAEGDIDNLEGRMGTAEGNITTLENSKQDVLSAGNSIKIENNEVSLKDWTIFDNTDWSELFEQVGTKYYAKEDLLIGHNYATTWSKISYKFIPKGTMFRNYLDDAISPYSVTSQFPVKDTVGLYTAYYRDTEDAVTSASVAIWLTGLILKGDTKTNPSYYILDICGYGSGYVQMTGRKKTTLSNFLTAPNTVTDCCMAIFRRN